MVERRSGHGSRWAAGTWALALACAGLGLFMGCEGVDARDDDAHLGRAEEQDRGGTAGSLSSRRVPGPVGGDIVDRAAATILGKALFWDIQASGDGKVACATCHFHAGADSRMMNTLNPGP